MEQLGRASGLGLLPQREGWVQTFTKSAANLHSRLKDRQQNSPTFLASTWGASEAQGPGGFPTTLKSPTETKSEDLHLHALAAGLTLAPRAADVLVTSDIATSTTWTANNVYNLQDQIYVLPGATLTIEAGTPSTANLGGSLAVCRGAQINVLGTASAPVIMTSDADDLTTWREVCNEWGNLTIMGNAYISENATVGNTPFPSASNVAAMEGLVASFPGDPNVLYGGGDDDDDSGSISYLSVRYGGKVIGLGNELNGISLGGIGRGTDISHVEVLNNVDDGIEIWGGTFNMRNFSIWNGDDSLDIDQGFRGRAQYGLIVQGFSTDAPQGSGVGDNACEIDGAEDSTGSPSRRPRSTT